MDSTSVSKHIAHRLKEIGTTTTFSTSGQYTSHLLKHLQQMEGMKLITTSTPEEAFYAAEGYSKAKRIRGKTSIPGSVIVSFGPNALTTMSALFGSFTEKVPMIIINGLPPMKDHMSKKRYKIMEKSFEMFEKVTVKSVRLTSTGMNAKIIDEMIEMCLVECRPVYIEIPEDVLKMNIQSGQKKLKIENVMTDKNELKKGLNEIFKNLKKSTKTLVWVGSEVSRMDSGELVEEFLKKSELNWATTILGKSVINEEMKGFVGVYCGRSSSKKTFEAFKQAEFILGLGVTLIEIDHLQMSIREELSCDTNYICAMENYIRGNCLNCAPVGIKDLLTEMNKNMNELKSCKPYFETIKFMKKEIKWNDQLTYDGIVNHLVEMEYFKDKIIVVDNTLGIFPLTNVPLFEKDCFYSQIGYGSYGFSLPYAMGVYDVMKKKTVVFIGDGSLQGMFYSINSLVRSKTDVVIFVFSNGTLSLTQWNQNPKVFKGKEDLDDINIIKKWDYTGMMKSLGGEGFSVKTHNDLKKVLDSVEKKKGVILISMEIPKKDYPETTKWNIEK